MHLFPRDVRVNASMWQNHPCKCHRETTFEWQGKAIRTVLRVGGGLLSCFTAHCFRFIQLGAGDRKASAQHVV